MAIPDPDTDSSSNKKRGLDLVIPQIDKRSAFYKRRARLTERILKDIPNPTEKQIGIAERAAVLWMGLEDTEAAIASGVAVDLGQYTTTCNAFRRLLESLAADAAETIQAEKALRELKFKMEAIAESTKDQERRANEPKPEWLKRVLAHSRTPRFKR